MRSARAAAQADAAPRRAAHPRRTLQASTAVFDDTTMTRVLSSEVFARFRECLVSGAPTPEDDQKVIAREMFTWARGLGATSFAHWFFPMRGGGGATGGCLGALKMDAFIDLVWSSDATIKARCARARRPSSRFAPAHAPSPPLTPPDGGCVSGLRS